MKYIQKVKWVVIAFTAMVILFVGCTGNDDRDSSISVTSISFDITTEQVKAIGETFDLTATITPGNATNKRIIWKSLQPNVAMVFADGLTGTVITITPGNTIIMAVTEDGGLLASCSVTVQ